MKRNAERLALRGSSSREFDVLLKFDQVGSRVRWIWVEGASSPYVGLWDKKRRGPVRGSTAAGSTEYLELGIDA